MQYPGEPPKNGLVHARPPVAVKEYRQHSHSLVGTCTLSAVVSGGTLCSCLPFFLVHVPAGAARNIAAMDLFVSGRCPAAAGPRVQQQHSGHIVQLQQHARAAGQARTRVRCVKPEALYAPKLPEHRQQLEPRSALALQIAEASGARPSHIGLSTPSVPQSSAPRRLRVAVDVDEGQSGAYQRVLLTCCTTTAAQRSRALPTQHI